MIFFIILRRFSNLQKFKITLSYKELINTDRMKMETKNSDLEISFFHRRRIAIAKNKR